MDTAKDMKSRTHAPYAPPATVVDIIRHFREKDVPDELTKVRLTQIGVTDGLLPRTWATLMFLGLIREDGTTTEEFRNLRYADDTQYGEVLLGILRVAYGDIFEAADPTTSTIFRLNDAFRPYKPGGQRSRMVTLFLGLCREAGLQTFVQAAERGSRIGGTGKARKQVEPKGKKGKTPPPPPPPPPPPAGGLTAVAQQYAQLLLEEAKEADGDARRDLFDRIERVLGVTANKGTDEQAGRPPAE